MHVFKRSDVIVEKVQTKGSDNAIFCASDRHGDLLLYVFLIHVFAEVLPSTPFLAPGGDLGPCVA